MLRFMHHHQALILGRAVEEPRGQDDLRGHESDDGRTGSRCDACNDTSDALLGPPAHLTTDASITDGEYAERRDCRQQPGYSQRTLHRRWDTRQGRLHSLYRGFNRDTHRVT